MSAPGPSATASGAAEQAKAALGDDIGCHFDHVAIAAPRLRDLVPLWVDALNGEFLGGGANTRVGYRTARIAYSGGFAIELMQPLPGSHFFDRFFQKNPTGGVHHITMNVDNHELAYERLIAAGYEPFGRSYANPTWHEMFLHPKIAHGVLLQVVRHPRTAAALARRSSSTWPRSSSFDGVGRGADVARVTAPMAPAEPAPTGYGGQDGVVRRRRRA